MIGSVPARANGPARLAEQSENEGSCKIISKERILFKSSNDNVQYVVAMF
jgi:hypothetical protein